MCARTHLGCLRQGEYDSTLAVATKLGTFQHSVVTSSPLGRGGLITRALSITVGWLPTVQAPNVRSRFLDRQEGSENIFRRSRDGCGSPDDGDARQLMPSAVRWL